MNGSRVTIILTVFNGEKFIVQTIQNILNLTYNNQEVIIINDGSSDRSDDIITQQLTRCPSDQFIYIAQENKGKVACVNRALSLAKGQYITLLDQDDFFPPQSIEFRAHYLDQHPDVIGVYGDAELMNERGNVFGKKKSRPVKTIRELIDFFWNPIASCSMMFRKEVMTTIGLFDERIRRLDDVDRNIQLFLAGPIVYMPVTLLTFRIYRRKEFARIRVLTIKEFGLLAHKYFKRPVSTSIVIKQFLFQIMKFIYECLYFMNCR